MDSIIHVSLIAELYCDICPNDIKSNKQII